MLKKILKGLALLVGIFLLFAFTAPFLFKKQLVGALKKEMNAQLNAQVDFNDVSLSFFRRFPRVSVAVEGLRVVGSGAFEGDTLVQANKVEAALNFWSVVRGSDFKIYSVSLDAPRINAIVHKDGAANWDILKPDTSAATSEASAPYTLQLTKYALTNADIRYTDESAGIYTHLSGLDHEGSGDFTSEKFTLKTKTKAGGLTVRYGAIPYLSDVATTVDADLEIDNKTNTYTFNNGKISINALQLLTNGSVQLLTDSTYKMDLSLKAPSTTFREVLSLIPALYKKDFDKIKTSGSAKFEGFVKGVYGPTQLPAFNVKLDVANGFFQYPDLPQPVKNINLALQVENPDGVTDHTTIRLPQAHFEMGGAPIDGHLLLTQPTSAMNIDGAVKGRLDLAQIGRMVKLEAGTKLAGIALADVTMKGSVAALQQKRYEGFNAGGTLRLDGFEYASKDYPAGVALSTLLATFNPRNITLSQLVGRYGKTNFTASGTLDNALAYALKNDPLSGRMQFHADAINLDEFIPVSADTAQASSAAAQPFLVPGNLDLGLTASVDAVHYDKVDLKGVSGALLVKDETVFMNDVRAAALEGTMKINGSYSTLHDKKHPDISLTYDVQGLDIQKTFLAFNTVQKLMPVGKYLGGKLSSQLSLTGKLGAGMMPDYNTLTGKGNLLLIEGLLQKFAPVDKLANTLQISQLQNISLKDVKSFFEFANGKVLVKPFTVKVADMELEAGGLHGIDQSLDYVLNLKVPRARLGAGANNFVNNLAAQAAGRGIPVKLGDVVNLKVNMGGTITNPQIRTAFKESAASLADDLKQQANAFVQAKVDSSKKLLRDTVQAVKKQLIDNAKTELLKKLAGGNSSSGDTAATKPAPVEDIRKKAENTGKSLLNNLFGRKEKKDTAQ
ncbi:hypothetical protein EPD60_13815 [Flaviaesturariibacter flavus]|uniref:Uncharacterized protein n=1 Tax=Flaviaesturariibacter flavus TaxID=2502780 RepID=A0A4R1B683_9BACT|nr:AsmA-like C-terminal region-containing protein [Flaviaesturariibacter flavus]TCJ13140.1 hypothetical protein EPD60_13815 [Flaviaesturariibacter flavus]